MKLTKLFIFCFSSLLFSVYGQAQYIAVKGKIVDEKGLSVPGATILIKGTSKSTISDLDGVYEIKAPTNGSLTISYVGYETVQETINGRTKIDFKLVLSNQDLQEVVVVGYGTQKKSVVTGAISSIKAKDLEDLPITRIEQSLQGRVSGVFIAANSGAPGSSATVRVRGITSLGNNEPLWVIELRVTDGGPVSDLPVFAVPILDVIRPNNTHLL